MHRLALILIATAPPPPPIVSANCLLGVRRCAWAFPLLIPKWRQQSGFSWIYICSRLLIWGLWVFWGKFWVYFVDSLAPPFPPGQIRAVPWRRKQGDELALRCPPPSRCLLATVFDAEGGRKARRGGSLVLFRPACTSLLSLWVSLDPDNNDVSRCDDSGCDLLGDAPPYLCSFSGRNENWEPLETCPHPLIPLTALSMPSFS